MKHVEKTCLLSILLTLSIAVVLASGHHVRGDAAALEASPTDQGKQPAPTEVQAACAATEPAPLLPPHEEAAVRDAAQKALDAYNSNQVDSIPLEIMSIWGQDGWAVVECIRDLSDQPASGTESTLLLANRSAGQWAVALPGDSIYSSWLDEIPDCYMAPASKEEVRQLNVVAPDLIEPSIGIYRLPYPDGASVYITQDSDQHGGPIDMWSANNSVVAAMSGLVVDFTDVYTKCCCNSACNACTNWIKLSHPSGEITRYLHIAQNSVKVTVGQWVEAGTVIATQSDVGHSCGSGRLETGCGSYHGDTHCGTHVHFEVRSSAGAYLKPRICDGQGGWFYPEYGDTHIATGCPENCCCSSRHSACGPSQPGWGFSTGALTAQPTGIGEPIVIPDAADHLELANASEPQAISEVELDESSAPTSMAIHRHPVELQRTLPTSATYRISRSVFGAGGGEKSSASFAMNGTQGQSTDLNRRESISYVLVPGYWGQWYPILKFELYLPLALKNH
jgi:murein DD-endopeptidase MepM/ murein hydrolase activator NlpD